MKTPIRTKPRPPCRQRPSRWLKRQILEAQNYQCRSCRRALRDVEFDHVVPLGLQGLNHPDNWAALCPTCHKTKTARDLERMAKADRQRRYHDTGKSRAPRATPGCGFNRALRRHLNGVVLAICDCAACQRARP